jgi:hypothetical protein
MSCCAAGGSCAAGGQCPLARAMRAASPHTPLAPGSAPAERFLPRHCGDAGPSAVTGQHDPWVPAAGTPLPSASGSVIGLSPSAARPAAIVLSPPLPPPRAESSHPAS